MRLKYEAAKKVSDEDGYTILSVPRSKTFWEWFTGKNPVPELFARRSYESEWTDLRASRKCSVTRSIALFECVRVIDLKAHLKSVLQDMEGL